ncbi:hypothetical protein KUIN1_46740 [Pseudomonas sp. KUIN-1]|nr:hypothetical protein KUIN1_46740 [Pseudomonas sp. KUIN-1]
MSAKGPPSFPDMHRLSDRLREQVRPYPSGRRPFLILPNGRRSGLVREGAVKLSENASPDATVFANKFATGSGQNQKRACV